MASSIPIVRQIAWLSVLPQMIILIGLFGLFFTFGVEAPIGPGSLAYLAYFFSARYLIPKDHRKGISAAKRNDYETALSNFEQSYQFFQRHRWVDKWRALVLLSSSKVSYAEIALINIAFCYAQLGDGVKSKQVYEQTLVNSQVAGWL